MAQQGPIDDYDIEQIDNLGYYPTAILGTGGFGVVLRCERTDGQPGPVAIKLMKTGQGPIYQVHQEKIINEREIINVLTENNRRHPNVLHIHVFTPYISPLRAYFISDLSPIGDLFSHYQRPNQQNINVWLPMRENECRFIFRGVAEGLQWMNNLGVAHGDLKPQNILLFWRGQPPVGTADTRFPAFNRMIPKLCDFGNSSRRQPDDPPGKIMYDTETCTVTFAAPESYYRTGNIPDEYDMIAADCFSLGNNILAMLLGALPYNHFMGEVPQDPNEQDLFNQRVHRSCVQLKRDYSYTRRLVANFQYQLREVLIGLLDPNPNTRMNLATFLQHLWLRQGTADDLPWSRTEPISSGTQPFHPIGPRRQRLRSIEWVAGREPSPVRPPSPHNPSPPPRPPASPPPPPSPPRSPRVQSRPPRPVIERRQERRTAPYHSTTGPSRAPRI